MFEEFIPVKKYKCDEFLRMLKRLFPRGPIWGFTIGSCPTGPEWSYLSTHIHDDFDDNEIDSWWEGEAAIGYADTLINVSTGVGVINYTWVGGSSPGFGSYINVGDSVIINSPNFNAANNRYAEVTAVGSNFFTISDFGTPGVAETKLLGSTEAIKTDIKSYTIQDYGGVNAATRGGSATSTWGWLSPKGTALKGFFDLAYQVRYSSDPTTGYDPSLFIGVTGDGNSKPDGVDTPKIVCGPYRVDIGSGPQMYLYLYTGASTSNEYISFPHNPDDYVDFRILRGYHIRPNGDTRLNSQNPGVYGGDDTIHVYYWRHSSNPVYNDTSWQKFTTTPQDDSGDFNLWIKGGSDMGIRELEFQCTEGMPYSEETIEDVDYSLLGILMSCFASELSRFSDKFVDLMRESVPGLSTLDGLLTDWERIAGLPDSCSSLGSSLSQRQQAVHAKIYSRYSGLTEQFFINYAEALGMTISITQDPGGIPFRTTTKTTGNDQRVTRMPAAYNPGTPTERIDGSRLNSVVSTYAFTVTVLTDPDGNQDVLECIFNKMKPAFTNMNFIKI